MDNQVVGVGDFCKDGKADLSTYSHLVGHRVIIRRNGTNRTGYIMWHFVTTLLLRYGYVISTFSELMIMGSNL